MGGQALVVPYDVSMQYVQGKMRRIYHDFHDWGNEMVLVLEGTGRYYLNDFSFEIGRGDIFVLRGTTPKRFGTPTVCAFVPFISAKRTCSGWRGPSAVWRGIRPCLSKIP